MAVPEQVQGRCCVGCLLRAVTRKMPRAKARLDPFAKPNLQGTRAKKAGTFQLLEKRACHVDPSSSGSKAPASNTPNISTFIKDRPAHHTGPPSVVRFEESFPIASFFARQLRTVASIDRPGAQLLTATTASYRCPRLRVSRPRG